MYFAYYEAFTLHITKNFCCPWRIRTSTAWIKTRCPAIRPKDNLICTDGEIRTPIDGFGDRHATIAPHPCVYCGATGDRTRVPWVQVRNFSQLNYGPIWSGRLDSNQRAPASKAGEDDLTPLLPDIADPPGIEPGLPDFQSGALPTELRVQKKTPILFWESEFLYVWFLYFYINLILRLPISRFVQYTILQSPPVQTGYCLEA